MRGATTIRHLWGERRRVVGHWLAVTLTLVILVGLLAGIIVPPATYLAGHRYDPYFQIVVDGRLDLSLHETLAVARRLDELVDQIEAQEPDWLEPASGLAVDAWTAELAPMFQYEGASTVVNYPRVRFAISRDGYTHNHLAGQSNCADQILLNLRYLNPVSYWHDRGNWLSVLAHELGHAHQTEVGCDHSANSRSRIETTAQLMSWEVLASLANKGSDVALYALLDSLRGDFIDRALGLALKTDQLPTFERALRDIQDHDPTEWARYEKSMRFWADDMDQLQAILTNYSAIPIGLIASYRHAGAIPRLALDTKSRALEIDDLLYVLAHAEDLVEGYLND